MNCKSNPIKTSLENIFDELKTRFSNCLFKSLISSDKTEAEVYGKILSTGKEEPRQISIISKTMIDCDEAFINSQKQFPYGLNLDDYHPYACEFFVEKWKDNNQNFKKLSGKWFSIKLVFGELVKECTCQGVLVFSASPIQRIRCGIEFFYKKTIPEDPSIENYVKNKISKQFEKEPSFDFKCIKKLSGSIYNVGQGNFVYLNFNDSFKMLFDAGETPIPSAILKEQEYIDINSREISQLKPDYIIISHWDLDHILGIQHFVEEEGKYSFFKTPRWIAPDIRLLDDKNGMCKASIYAQRVCVYLLEVGTLLLINQPDELCMNIKSDLQLFQGNCKGSPGSKANNIGLILSIQVKNNSQVKQLLFSGDCSYWKMRKGLFDNKKDEKDNNKTYDFLVSSHHGAASAVKNGSKFFGPKASKEAKAIISTGYNKHGHPHVEHLAFLQNQGFEILFTSGYEKIDFYISEDGDLHINPVKSLTLKND